MKDTAEMAGLRTLLKNVNVEYRALLRGTGHEGKLVKLEELKERRLALMFRIAELRRRQATDEPPVAKHSQTRALLTVALMARAMAATVQRKWARWLGGSQAPSGATAVPSSE